MQEWETTLDKFRQFGGIAENVSLGHGKYGRGLFPDDVKKSVKLQVPENLLVPIEWLNINEAGELSLSDACTWHEDLKAFYLRYLSEYGFTGALIAAFMDEQTELFNLPEHIKNMLINYGVEKSYFAQPSYAAVLDRFKHSRRIAINNQLYLMPVVELVNHSSKSKYGFVLSPLIGIAGQFKDEVLVNYGTQADALNFYTVYGFSEIRPYAFSGTLSLDLGPAVLNIARFTNINQTMGEVKAPQLRAQGSSIDLSFLLLANTKHKDSPRVIFNRLMQQVNMPTKIANEVFDGLVAQNINFLQLLMKELAPVGGKVAEGLKQMTKNQLFAYGVFK